MNHLDTKAPIAPIPDHLDRIAKIIVDAAFRVHSVLGPGLLETVYEVCHAHEIQKRGLLVERQVALPVQYDEVRLDVGLRLDLVVERSIIVEVKAIDMIHPVHFAQVLTYLKLTGYRLGFLINFNVPIFRTGIRRIVL